MYVLICFLFLLQQASGASLVIPAEPHRKKIENIERYNVVYGFRRATSGEFQVRVTVHYLNTWSRIHRVKHFIFRLQRGTVIQRDSKSLVLRLENRELIVGKHRWWYDPYWQAADDVRIICDHDKRFETVVVKNCRLAIEKP